MLNMGTGDAFFFHVIYHNSTFNPRAPDDCNPRVCALNSAKHVRSRNNMYRAQKNHIKIWPFLTLSSQPLVLPFKVKIHD